MKKFLENCLIILVIYLFSIQPYAYGCLQGSTCQRPSDCPANQVCNSGKDGKCHCKAKPKPKMEVDDVDVENTGSDGGGGSGGIEGITGY